VSTVDWILFAVCWSAVPAVLILKVVLGREQAKSERECWRKVDALRAPGVRPDLTPTEKA
jgi:hypothetical protein